MTLDLLSDIFLEKPKTLPLLFLMK